MSSYLVAFFVSEFVPISAVPGLSKAQFKIWARANAINQTKLVFYINEVGLKFINCIMLYV